MILRQERERCNGRDGDTSMTQEEMRQILEIGVSLSMEKDFNKLLETILEQVMELTRCDAGTLYLLEGEHLKFQFMKNKSMDPGRGADWEGSGLPPVPLTRRNLCAMALLDKRTILVEDVRNCETYDFSGPARYDAMTGYHTKSLLVTPLWNRTGERLGVLQLINAMDETGAVCGFSEEMVLAVESVASQAAITIQNSRYISEVKGLIQSFVRMTSSAIDARTPYNASHTRNMAVYGERFLTYMNRVARRSGKGVLFSKAHREELLMSIWLHDIGKIVTPLEIMNKNARLSPVQYAEVKGRLKEVRLLARLAYLEGRSDQETWRQIQTETAQAQKLVDTVNRIGFLPDDLAGQVRELGEKRFTDEAGRELPWLTQEECGALQTRKGTISAEERRIMQDHVVLTDRFLAEVEFPKEYSHVREWAAGHHEMLDGSGYPKGLRGDQIPMEVRIITLLDVFEALIAKDRPYKKGIPVEQALEVLMEMAEKERKLDIGLVRMFAASRCWEEPKQERSLEEGQEV